MNTFASILLLFTVLNLGVPAQAAPSAAQTDNVREAVFRALFVRAKTIMPGAKVYILEKDGHHPREWGNMSDFDPDADLLKRFADNTPPVVPISQSGSGASATEEWHEDKDHVHGPLLQIVSLHWLSGTSVEAETDIDVGLPRPAVSLPYLVTLQQGQWTAREDVRTEWRQAVQEGDIREAVVREQLETGVYGAKPETTPCFLSFGLFSAGASADPPNTFMERFAGGPIRLGKASQRPGPGSHKPYMLIGVEHIRWVSDTEVEVDGSGTRSNSRGAESNLYDVTCNKNGWTVQPIFEISI